MNDELLILGAFWALVAACVVLAVLIVVQPIWEWVRRKV